MRRMFFFAIAQDPGTLQRLTGKKNPFIEHIEDYKQMLEKVRAGDGRGAEELYQRLPEETKKQKSVMLAHVFASSKLGDDAYVKAIDEMRHLFPHDGGVDLMSIDAFSLKQKWPQALAAIDRVDGAVGGDPYLDVFRSNIHLRAGHLDQARDCAARAAGREPTLPQAFWAQVNVSLAQADYAETARVLAHLRDVLHVELPDLTQVPEYQGFVASPEYEEFAAKL
jgi:predicted Zn-dependent protease